MYPRGARTTPAVKLDFIQMICLKGRERSEESSQLGKLAEVFGCWLEIQICPLALGFDTQVCTDFMKGDFDLPIGGVFA
jgi:hypothetical protein